MMQNAESSEYVFRFKDIDSFPPPSPEERHCYYLLLISSSVDVLTEGVVYTRIFQLIIRRLEEHRSSILQHEGVAFKL